MLEPIVEIPMGNWYWSVFNRSQLKRQKRIDCPVLPAAYVLQWKRRNYAGESADSLWRAREHNQKHWDTVSIVWHQSKTLDDSIRVLLEFGLTLIHLGCVRRVANKVADLPTYDKRSRRLALDFFEAYLKHFNSVARFTLGSQSSQSYKAAHIAVEYLRYILRRR